jgi:hypothetical protein
MPDPLPADCRGGQACRQAVGAARRVRLTGAIAEGGESAQQGWQRLCRALATACCQGIEASQPPVQCVRPLAHGPPAPPACAFRTPLAPGSQCSAGVGHP